MASVAVSITGPLTEVATAPAWLLQSDVIRLASHEGGPAFLAAHAAPEGFRKRAVGMTEPPLPSVQFIGSGLLLVQAEARV
jgi:hypothetical protein